MEGTSGQSSTSHSSDIYLMKQIESHSLELNSLTADCRTKLPKLMSQRLPRFMRRRASSHNPKRVPKSIRLAIEGKTNDSIEKHKKLKNQKKNKKHKKFVNEIKRKESIQRRNQKSERSVLHVWFAKRFHMKMFYNRLMPNNNCTKNERILYQNSKQDFVAYYLSTYVCIEIDYSVSEKQLLIDFLTKFTHLDISPSFGAKIYESGNREGITIIYNYESYPFEPLVSINFVWNHKFTKLWIWCHICVYDKLLNLFYDCQQKYLSKVDFKINGHKNQLERFRIIGPKGLMLLSKCFNFDFNQILDPKTVNSVHYLRISENKTSLIDSNETNLFLDNCFVSSSKKFINCFDFMLITKNNTFKNRVTYDLVVLSEFANRLWHKICENRGHRVGGIHDLNMISLNTSSLMFPEFGFIDSFENKTTIELLNKLLKREPNSTLYIIRNDLMLSMLCKDLRLLSKISFNNIYNKDNALINVEVVCVGRGVPQQFDYICVPNDSDIESIGQTSDEDIINEDKCNQLNRKIIGLIEFGKYSLEISRGKGLGVITIIGLEELIQINDNINLKNNYKNNIIAIFKSNKSCIYRQIIIKAIDSAFSI
ncbi:ribonucleases P/MRP protein subunit popl-1-like [Oppia nitens]|uniref:ribonucleases P/MRP protein subunit popl-1-like n=1 Tax=Oppia nitens TaxID=1686743 RepID=UPI0023DC4FB0|nr:ribonucleases P/MRP protein subunit popl-1-like [Oppia nitens]